MSTYELTIMADGSAMLADEDGALCWSSDSDDAFLEEFAIPVDPDDADEICEYLEDEGYVEPDDDIDIVVDGDDVDTVNGERTN